MKTDGTFRQRREQVSKAVDAHMNNKKYSWQMFAAIGAGIAAAFLSGFAGLLIRLMASDQKAGQGTVIMNGIPLTAGVIACLLAAGLGLIAGVLLYGLGLYVCYWIKIK